MIVKKLTLEDALSLDLFDSILAPQELTEFKSQNKDLRIEKYTLQLEDGYFSHWEKTLVKEKNRRGEVAMAIRNPKGQILLHTKSYYPDGAFRIPTGGVKIDEPVANALKRELFEETGFSENKASMLAIVLFEFKNKNKSLPFASYLYLIDVGEGEPKVQDAGEEISSFKWVDRKGLEQTVQQLKSLSNTWAHWGMVRAIPHEILLQLMI